MKQLIPCLIIFAIILINYVAVSQYARCTSEERCILFRECAQLRKITDKGHVTPEEVTFLRSKHCNTINRYPHVCCPNQNQKYVLPKPPVCGIVLRDRNIRGDVTNIDEFGWIAQIQYLKPGNIIDSHCGGSLIHERFVLTAAHCVRKIPNSWKLIQVRLGDWDTRTNPDCEEFVNERICNDPYVEVPVTQVIVHENYNPNDPRQQNDIALLKLQGDVKFTDFIKPICLPVDLDLRSINYTSFSMEAAAFGRTKLGGAFPRQLGRSLNVIPQDSCRNIYATQNIQILNSQICAVIDYNKDVCDGDDGGGLMKELSQNVKLPHFILVGIASFRPNYCGNRSLPGVFTRVSEYIDWIIQNM